MIEKVRDAIALPVEKAGYEIVDIEYKSTFGVMALSIYIFKKGGVSLADCELVNNIVSPIIDEVDPTDGAPFSLNISSPGLDRPIVTEDDLRRNLDEDVEAVLHKPIDGKKRVHGNLVGYTDTDITLLIDGKETKIEKSGIKKLQIYIKF